MKQWGIQYVTVCHVLGFFRGALFSMTPSCAAVQWLEPAQTAGRKQPYLYTQCQEAK